MDWKAVFVVYRIEKDLTLKEVFHPADLQKAQYWVKYIALPGDVCCRTPIHPKHSKASKGPEYFAHKDNGGQVSKNQDDWWSYARSQNFQGALPEEPLG